VPVHATGYRRLRSLQCLSIKMVKGDMAMYHRLNMGRNQAGIPSLVSRGSRALIMEMMRDFSTMPADLYPRHQLEGPQLHRQMNSSWQILLHIGNPRFPPLTVPTARRSLGISINTNQLPAQVILLHLHPRHTTLNNSRAHSLNIKDKHQVPPIYSSHIQHHP
jgi:hypothetical protein